MIRSLSWGIASPAAQLLAVALVKHLRMVDEDGDLHWSFHDCRHYHASVLIGQGMEPQLVCERLGHANVTTTLRIYTHLFQAHRGLGNVRAVELEDQVLAIGAPLLIAARASEPVSDGEAQEA